MGKISKEELMTRLEEAPIVLTTYSMVSTRGSHKGKDKNGKKYHSLLWDIEWTRVIYDESHHLRNEKSNKHQGAKNKVTDYVVTNGDAHTKSQQRSLFTVENYGDLR